MYATVFSKCRSSLGEHALVLFVTINILGVLAAGLAQGVWVAVGLAVASAIVWSLPASAGRRGAAAHVAHSGGAAVDAWLDAFARWAKAVVFLLMSVAGAGLIWLLIKMDIGSGWIIPGLALGLIMAAGGLKLFVEEVFGVSLVFENDYSDSDDHDFLYNRYRRLYDISEPFHPNYLRMMANGGSLSLSYDINETLIDLYGEDYVWPVPYHGDWDSDWHRD